MNQPDKHSRSFIETLITEIIAEISLEDRVKFANLAEDEIQVLEAILGKFLNYRLEKLDEKLNEELLKECRAKSGDKSLDHSGAAVFILKELWNRLRDTYKLRVVK
jgi:hypothetical protein